MKKRDEILDGLVSTLTDALDSIERQAAAAGLRGDTVELFKDVKLIVDTKEIIAAIQQLRAEAATAKKQVEFLEWFSLQALLWAKTQTVIISENAKDTNSQEQRGVVSTTVLLGGKALITFSGQLRDGWRHWDAIKEAVK